MQISSFMLLFGDPSRIGLHTLIFQNNIIFLIWCIATAVLLTEWDISPLFGKSCTCALHNRQDVANQRQSRAGHAEQGSVIQTNAATAAK